MPTPHAPAPLSGALVWTRAGVTAFFAFAVGTVAHWSAGGLTPGPVGLALLLGSLVLPSAALLHRRASTVRWVAMIAVGQLWTHFWLTAAAGHRGDGVAAGQSRSALPHHDMVALPTDAGRRTGSLLDLHQQALDRQISAADTMPDPFADAVGHLVADLTGPHALMMLAHLLAGAGIGAWLAWGEHALFSLAVLAVGALCFATLRGLLAAGADLRAALVALRRPRGLWVPTRRPPPPGRLLLGPAPRRGPPAVLAA